MEWQLMETAPKDGTRVLLYYRDYCGGGWLITIGEWSENGSEPDEFRDSWEHEFGSGDADAWMPIPEAPVQQTS